jgi:hypothetical protein
MHSGLKGRFLLLCYGLLSLAVYGGMTWLSYAFVYGQGHRQRPFFTFLGLYAAAFVLYWLALRGLPRLSRTCGDLGLILGFAVLFRVLVLWSNPIQEDDFYRYLWDGKVVASGLNPYRFAPQTVETYTGGDERIQPYAAIAQEDPAMAVVLSRVNHPDVPTIYPPLAQGVFALAAFMAPGNLQVLRLVLLAFDIALGIVVIALLQRLAIPLVYILVYAWSPLVIKESLNSAHYDVVPTFFFIGALWLSLQDTTGEIPPVPPFAKGGAQKAPLPKGAARSAGGFCSRSTITLAHISLALAILGKVYPLLFVPVLWWRTWQRHGYVGALSGLAVTVVVIVLGYIPFLAAGSLLWQGTQAFAERWQTNGALFPLLAQIVGERWLANTFVVLLLGGAVISVLVRYDLRDEREFLWSVFLLLGALLLLSPVGNPWYFLWLVPLLCVFPLRSWLLLSGLLGLYYLSFYFMYHKTPETFRWVLWLEYVPFYGMLVWEWMTLRSHNGLAPPAESFLRPAVQSLSQPDDPLVEKTTVR